MTSPLQQKIKITGPSIVTANRTSDGVVIYRTAAKDWSTELGRAAIVRAADEARALLAESVADDLGAVGPYIAPVELSGPRCTVLQPVGREPHHHQLRPRSRRQQL